MPTLSVFFRKDDVALWKALPNKSEWLHDNLNVATISETVAEDLEVLRKQRVDHLESHGIPSTYDGSPIRSDPTITPPEDVA